jgi:uncharacterized protein YbjT (DUF2867 family)
MKIAIAGATGRAGRHVVEVIREQGHEPVEIARAKGIDVITGEGLAAALDGVDAVIDVATGPSPEEQAATEFFLTATRNLQAASPPLIVMASIIGVDRMEPVDYNAAKLAHERALREGPVPARILRAAQFHEFVEQLLQWGDRGDHIEVPVMRMQPVAARSVAERLVELATAADAPALSEIAGPREERLGELATLYSTTRGDGRPVREVESDDPGYAAGALLPGADALLAGPTYAEWLAS